MKIFAVISANGLGHYKRTIEILHALKQVQPDAAVSVACEAWQIDRMNDWEVSLEFWKLKAVQHFDNLIAPGVRWSKNPEDYKDGSLTSWHKRLQDIRELKEADLVLSDNLPQVLHYRPDAVLIGSFLWSDILAAAYPHDQYVQQFAEEEKRLLDDCHPSMICLEDMAMPGVLQQTEAVQMPWFCVKKYEVNKIQNPIPKIGLLGGATESVSACLVQMAQKLSKTGKAISLLPKPLLMQLKANDMIQAFDFEDSSFAELDAIVCRPGIGTLTDGVRFGIPLITVHENGNIEMMHNAANVQALNIGLNLGSDVTIEQMCDSILAFVYSEELIAARENICARPDHGIEKAVSWIFENYN